MIFTKRTLFYSSPAGDLVKIASLFQLGLGLGDFHISHTFLEVWDSIEKYIYISYVWVLTTCLSHTFLDVWLRRDSRSHQPRASSKASLSHQQVFGEPTVSPSHANSWTCELGTAVDPDHPHLAADRLPCSKSLTSQASGSTSPNSYTILN